MRNQPALRGASDSGAPCHYLRLVVTGLGPARPRVAAATLLQRRMGASPSQTLPLGRLGPTTAQRPSRGLATPAPLPLRL